jgi:hypothetical protein
MNWPSWVSFPTPRWPSSPARTFGTVWQKRRALRIYKNLHALDTGPAVSHHCNWMKHLRLALILAAFYSSSPIGTLAQDPIRNALSMGLGDVAATKKKAEAGDAQSQRSLGDRLASNLRSADALQWYQRSANQSNV